MTSVCVAGAGVIGSLFAGHLAHVAEVSVLTRRDEHARALNEESTQISEIILKLWVKYKDNHKLKDTYSDGNAKLDRNRFIRLFSSAASAEVAKKLDPDDKNAEKDSK